MDPHSDPDVVIAVAVLRDLKDKPIEPDTVVVAHSAFALFTEDIPNGGTGPRDEHAGRLLRGQGKLFIVGPQIGGSDIGIGFVHVGDAGKGEFLEEPLLVSAEGAL